MPIHKLTAPKIAALIRKGRDGLFGDGGNLYLQIDGGSASWLLRFMRLGQRRHMGLGPLHTVNLAEARELALAARKVLLAGGDPLAARALTRVRSMTFDACVGKYLDAHRAGWKNPKHRQQWESTLRTHASPMFGALPVAAIDTGLVMKAIEPIWTKTPETAGRLRGRIESFSIGRGCVATGTVKIRPAGRVTLIICCRRVARSVRSSTMPRCPTPMFRPSWAGCAGRKALLGAHLNS